MVNAFQKPKVGGEKDVSITLQEKQTITPINWIFLILKIWGISKMTTDLAGWYKTVSSKEEILL